MLGMPVGAATQAAEGQGANPGRWPMTQSEASAMAVGLTRLWGHGLTTTTTLRELFDSDVFRRHGWAWDPW